MENLHWRAVWISGKFSRVQSKSRLMGLTLAQNEHRVGGEGREAWPRKVPCTSETAGQPAAWVITCLAQKCRLLPCGWPSLVLALHKMAKELNQISGLPSSANSLWFYLWKRKEAKQVTQITHVSFPWPLNWEPPTLKWVMFEMPHSKDHD